MLVDYNNANTLNFGDLKAAHQMTVFLNLACPFCRKSFLNNYQRIVKAVNEHELAVHFKFINKPKKPLENGNVAQLYIDYNNPDAALNYVHAVFENQKALKALSKDEVANYVQSTYNVKRVISDKNVQKVFQQAQALHATSVPNIFFDNQYHLDSNFVLPL